MSYHLEHIKVIDSNINKFYQDSAVLSLVLLYVYNFDYNDQMFGIMMIFNSFIIQEINDAKYSILAIITIDYQINYKDGKKISTS